MGTDRDNPDAPPSREHPREPPTLPLPSAWRLVVAGIVILAFLYLMYITALEEAPAPAQSSDATVGWVVSARR